MSTPRFFSFYPTDAEYDLVGKGPLAVKLGLAAVLIVALGATLIGPKWGLDFTGGTEIHIRVGPAVEGAAIRQTVEQAGFEKFQVQRFGTPDDHEWLVKVERIVAVTDDEVGRLRGAVERAFATELAAKPGVFAVERAGDVADEVAIRLPLPAVAEGDDVGAAATARNAQRDRIVHAITGDAGLKLRHTSQGDAAAVVLEEEDSGVASWSVNLEGISDELVRRLEAELGTVETLQVSFVDARIAESLKTDGAFALLVAIAMILIYVAVRFDLAFAPGAVYSLFHDPVIAFSVFIFFGVPFDLPSVAAMLTIIGYSINNTIVIYDRIRETLGPLDAERRVDDDEAAAIVNRAINSTMNRTINTTLTTLFTSVAVWVFTEGSVRNFAMTITIGFLVGAVSSVLIAPTVFLFLRRRMPTERVDHAAALASREEKARGVV